MADANLDLAACFGPHDQNLDPYAATPPANWSVFDDGDGDFWVRNTAFAGEWKPIPVVTEQGLAYGWAVFELHVETVGSVDCAGILFNATTGADTWIRLVRVSATTFRLNYHTSTGSGGTDGSNTLNDGTDYVIRVQWGSGGGLWIDGLGLDIASIGGKIPDIGAWMQDNAYSGGGDSGCRYRMRNMILCESFTAQARPDFAPDVKALYPSGDDLSANWADGTCSGNAGTYQHWDDYATGAPDGNVNCGESIDPAKEISTMTNATVAGVFGIQGHTYHAANVGSKTVGWFTVERDGSANEQEIAMTNAGDTAFSLAHTAVFRVAPDGAAWDQTKLDDLRFGHRNPSGNGAHIEVQATMCEAAGIGSDPAPASLPPVSPLRPMRPLLVR